ncbi:hypothetical protein LEP1GSC202_0468 [Leptospira yanagawae serovar Saopaulo str. Sao Paulo = ATCC 700523]|uniref:TIGR04452 family lipoprotein n=2 Tax=Leptospira yanagawae TaxID=293069 RepID=A0ABY2M8E2_9LEPT|nr:hypothetical protein [Leptospira yanagawae]EOQ90247.1 hypothetical protein LEP1GSC202_0468 [Leptospira yanagawae serovar Saopaulo str. Sao Paulo = ATCC 700523]TGL26028.1 hypothetical protein EHQ46_00665 [Leptospira yanagawae]
MKSIKVKSGFVSLAVIVALSTMSFVNCAQSSGKKNEDTTLLTYLVANPFTPQGAQADCLVSVGLINSCISSKTQIDAGVNCSLITIADNQAIGADYSTIKTAVIKKYNESKCNIAENKYTSASSAVDAFKDSLTFTSTSDASSKVVFSAPTYY